MYLDKLGFFKKKTELQNQNLKVHLNQSTTNLKNSIVKKMLLSYAQQQLHFLTTYAASTKISVKQKRLSKRLKHTIRYRRIRKHLTLKNNYTNYQRAYSHHQPIVKDSDISAIEPLPPRNEKSSPNCTL